MDKKKIFERHPCITLIVIVFVSLVALDQLAAFLFIKDRGDYSRFRVLNNYFHHGMLPMKKDIHKWGNRVYPIFTNSLGMKDNSHRDIKIQSDKERILFMGDSFVESEGVLYEESFIGLLDSKLAPKGIEVLNAGVTSYSPKLYYLRLRHLLEYVGLDIDQIFVFIDISDVENELDYAGWKSDIDNGKPFRYKWKHWITKRYKYFIRNYSFIYNRWRNFYHTVIKKPTEEEKFAESERRFLEEGQMKNLGNDEWSLKDELSERSHRGLKLAEENMSKFLEVCKSKGIEDVYIVVYPWPNNILNANKEILYTLFWGRFAKEKQVKFINLFPVFINEKLLIPSETVKKYYIDGDCHWNSNGHRLVADEILKQLGTCRQKHL